MSLPDILLSISLLSLGGAIVGAGIVCLDRRDRRWQDQSRQDACQWHQWQVLEDGRTIACSLCGKKTPKVRAARDVSSETAFSEKPLP